MASDPENKKDGIHVAHQETLAVGHHVAKAEILADMAQEGTELEHSLGTLEAVRIYWKAVTLCVLLALTIIMRGYDASVCTNFFGLPAFRNRFGYPVPGHGNQIPASWQSALGVATTVGQVFGSTLITYPLEWWGRKRVLVVCLLLTSAVVPMETFAPNIHVLTAGEYIMGFIAGSYQVLIPTYLAELLPTVLRPYLAAYINANYNMGGFLIAGVTAGFDNWVGEWAYKIPFLLQWVWPVIVLPTLYFTPESPWWLVRHDRLDEARQALLRLSSPHPKVDVDKTLAMIQKTNLYETKTETGVSFWDCFKGAARRRTEIVIMIFFCQDFAVSPVSATYFFQQLNITNNQAFDMNVGLTGVGFLFSMISAFVLRYVGRRTAFTTGIGVICALQFTVAFLQLSPSYDQNQGYSWAQIGLLITAQAIFNLTIGPLAYTILTEVPSMKLRSKSVAISIATDAICGIVTNSITPFLINPGEANAKGKADFLWGGVSVISFLWCIFRLPETKHRTFEEIDYLFENKVRTRDFKGYVIDDELMRRNLE